MPCGRQSGRNAPLFSPYRASQQAASRFQKRTDRHALPGALRGGRGPGCNPQLKALTQKASPNDVVIPTSANGQPHDALPPSGVQMELHVPADQEAVHPLWVMVGVEREVVGLLKEFGEHGAGLDARECRSDAEVDAVPEC